VLPLLVLLLLQCAKPCRDLSCLHRPVLPTGGGERQCRRCRDERRCEAGSAAPENQTEIKFVKNVFSLLRTDRGLRLIL
jgi:hypothetical protein